MRTTEVTYTALLSRRAKRTPERRALTFEGETWTYAELARRALACAGQLERVGVGPGDRVSYLGLNHPSFLLTLYACERLGAILVPLNFRLTGPELTFILGDAAAKVLVADDQHHGMIDTIRGDLPVETYLSAESDAPGWPALEASGEPLRAAATATDDDVAVIMYTSGTTGRPKGAMLTHRNLWWSNLNELHTYDVRPDDVTVTTMPLFHIGGLNLLTMVTLQLGGHVVLYRAFDPGQLLAEFAAYGVTTMMAVPAMYQALIDHPDFADADKTTVHMFLCGGAPCPVPLIKRYQQFGIDIVQGYGLTECSPAVCYLMPEAAAAGQGWSPFMFTDVKLADRSGQEITEPEVPGELCVRGPNVMKGYWRAEQQTAEALLPGGWLRTGDVAYRDANGFFQIVDRVTDMIISGGENIHPAEVENVLAGHPAIAEVAVVGTAHERWGETPVAIARLRPGAQLTLEELREFGGTSLAHYKLPTVLNVIEEPLPRNASGKILKLVLRDRLAAGPPAAH